MYVTVCLPDHVKQDSGNKHAWIPADVVEPLQTEIQPAVPQLFWISFVALWRNAGKITALMNWPLWREYPQQKPHSNVAALQP